MDTSNNKRKIFIILNIMKTLNETWNLNSESSESDNEMEKLIINEIKSKIKPRRRKIPKVHNYFEEIVPQYSIQEFQMHFRMLPQAFEALCQKIIPIIKRNCSTGCPHKNLEKQILSVVWLLGTPDSYRSVANRFDFGKSSLADAFVKVIHAMYEIAPDIIKWPRGETIDIIKGKFKSFAGIENVIGAVDGTYIRIKAPKKDAEVYNTRKCFYAFTLQCISEPSLKFIDAFIGYPGSVSDRRIFTQSNIYKNIELNLEHYFDNESFILGDKAYPLKTWCIPPFIEHRKLNNAQVYFNNAHAKTRQVVERSFALLFGRFRRLKFLDMNRIDLIPLTILACCILHNICIDYEDLLLENYILQGEDCLHFENCNINYEENQQAEQCLAETKRNAICYNLYTKRQRRSEH